jgi:hypothetical protein
MQEPINDSANAHNRTSLMGKTRGRSSKKEQPLGKGTGQRHVSLTSNRIRSMTWLLQYNLVDFEDSDVESTENIVPSPTPQGKSILPIQEASASSHGALGLVGATSIKRDTNRSNDSSDGTLMEVSGQFTIYNIHEP